MGSQLKNILETENNWDKVQECHNRNRSDFITDGHEYRKLREAGGFLCLPSNNVTFTFFTNGIPLFKSSKKVQVGKDQEKAQSEKDSHSKNRGGKKQTNNQVLIP